MRRKWLIVVLMFLCGCTVISPQVEPEPSPSLTPEPTPTPTPVSTPVVVETVDFEAVQRNDFQTVWTLSSDQIAYQRNTDGLLHEIVIDSWEHADETLMLSCYGLALEKGSSYTVELNVETDIASGLQIEVWNYESAFVSQYFTLSDKDRVVFSFAMNEESFYDAKLVLRFHRNAQNSGTISLSDLSVSSSKDLISVKVNQLGYLPDSYKSAVFSYNAGDTFDVIDTRTNEVVYTGLITGRKETPDASETNYVGDFSSVTKEGTYRIETQILASSYEFRIEENLMDPLIEDVLHALSTQRCGIDLSEEVYGALAHPACHTHEALSVVSDEWLDVTGGWHDAGDYGRYVTPGVKALSDLLLAYWLYPEQFDDQMGLMESGNGIPDLLDEAKVELMWLLKMQRESNAFYNSVITKTFAGMIAPEDDQEQLYLMKQENSATAAASGALSLASEVYQKFDESFAQQCLEAAEAAYAHAQWQSGSQDIFNPEGFDNGDYPNASDLDELYYAALSLYSVTHDEMYLKDAEQFFIQLPAVTGMTHDDFAGYGTVVHLLHRHQSELTKKISERFQNEVQSIVLRSSSNGYHEATDYAYSWGSSMYIANSAAVMLCAYELYHDEDLVKEIQNQLDFILGKNPVNVSFVTQVGTVYPRYPHNRLTISKDASMKGAVVSGIDRNLGSPALQSSGLKNLPAAKRYLDHVESYTNNEVAIYFHSGLIFVLSGMADLY